VPQASTNRAVYRTRNLSFQYGPAPVLTDVAMEIDAGEVACIVGPNGAGKSTLLRILGGLLPGYRGTVEFRDRPLAAWRARELARQVAYVPQQLEISFPYSVREVVLMGRLPHQTAPLFESAADVEAVESALAAADVAHLHGRTFGELSGGERQLVILASALAQEPRVMLLDEPTAFLDLKHQLMMARILRSLHDERQMTLVLVSHDLNLAEAFATRLLMFRGGALRHQITRADDGRLALEPEMIADVFDVDARAVVEARRERIVVTWGR